MYYVFGLLFCLLEGLLVREFGWTSIIWSSIGFLFGLFSTANILLPILMGYPLSIYYLIRKKIKPKVFLSLLYAPILWLTAFSLLFFFFPSMSSWIKQNTPLEIGNNFGFLAILITPLFKKGRDDFKSDFDKSYGKYYTQNILFDKEIKSLTKLYTNLFVESDKRFEMNRIIQDEEHKLKYLVFCLYISIKCIQDSLSDTLGTINRTMEVICEMIESKQFIDLSYTKIESVQIIKKYLLEYEEKWGEYVLTIENEDLLKSNEIISKMIYLAIMEKREEVNLEKVNELATYINSSLYLMRQSYDEMMLE